MLGSQRHDEVTQIFHHSADNDMVFSELGLLKRLENDVIFEDRLRSDLAHVEKLAVNIVNSNLILDFILFHVNVFFNEFHLSLLFFVDIGLLLLRFFVLKDRDILSIFLAASYEVAIVGELVIGVARWLWELVVTRVQHNVPLLAVDDNLKSEQKESVFFVDIVGNRAKLLAGKTPGNFLAIDLKSLSLPVLREPAPIALFFFLQLIVWVAARLNNVADQSHEAWAETTFCHQTELDLLDTHDLI